MLHLSLRDPRVVLVTVLQLSLRDPRVVLVTVLQLSLRDPRVVLMTVLQLSLRDQSMNLVVVVGVIKNPVNSIECEECYRVKNSEASIYPNCCCLTLRVNL
ncbi:UNVERIFIED_CONTAM: hypothetical protein RMT77_018735 [Armadillidium vulgare]